MTLHVAKRRPYIRKILTAEYLLNEDHYQYLSMDIAKIKLAAQ
jgi:hypothetical protein